MSAYRMARTGQSLVEYAMVVVAAIAILLLGAGALGGFLGAQLDCARSGDPSSCAVVAGGGGGPGGGGGGAPTPTPDPGSGGGGGGGGSPAGSAHTDFVASSSSDTINGLEAFRLTMTVTIDDPGAASAPFWYILNAQNPTCEMVNWNTNATGFWFCPGYHQVRVVDEASGLSDVVSSLVPCAFLSNPPGPFSGGTVAANFYSEVQAPGLNDSGFIDAGWPSPWSGPGCSSTAWVVPSLAVTQVATDASDPTKADIKYTWTIPGATHHYDLQYRDPFTLDWVTPPSSAFIGSNTTGTWTEQVPCDSVPADGNRHVEWSFSDSNGFAADSIVPLLDIGHADWTFSTAVLPETLCPPGPGPDFGGLDPAVTSKVLYDGWTANFDYAQLSGDQVVILKPAGSPDYFVTEWYSGWHSGSSEPDWSIAPNPGNLVSDGDNGYGWTNVGATIPSTTSHAWNTTYSPDTTLVIVSDAAGRDFIAFPGYGAIHTPNASGPWGPYGTAIGDYIYTDGGAYWMALGTAP